MLSHELLLVHLRAGGVLMALLVAVNLVVPARFQWREEMSRLSLVNRQIFEPTRLSRAVLIGLTIFWALRMGVQWFFYSPELWRGDPFNTAVHYAFSGLWIYLTVVFAAALWFNLK